MKVEGWVATDRVGSKSRFDVEISDEDMEGMSEEERNRHIDAEVWERLGERIDWGWSPIT